jgi:hypothetical protein
MHLSTENDFHYFYFYLNMNHYSSNILHSASSTLLNLSTEEASIITAHHLNKIHL